MWSRLSSVRPKDRVRRSVVAMLRARRRRRLSITTGSAEAVPEGQERDAGLVSPLCHASVTMSDEGVQQVMGLIREFGTLSPSPRIVGRAGMPVFPDALGGWRDPANTRRNLRNARGEFDWITSHAFRKTAASRLADAGVPTRQIADQLGHSRVSITQDSYMGRGVVGSRAAQILDEPGITGA